MSTANKTQVGGEHYRQPEGVPQHWDLATVYQWDFFQYQITKYVMRWKTKHSTPEKKLEDLKKARHFLDKYIEEYEKFLPAAPVAAPPPSQAPNEWWSNEGYYGDGTALFKCCSCGALRRVLHTPPQPHGCAPHAAQDPSQPAP